MAIRKTITTIFMVPTLKVPTNFLKDNGIINGYIKDVDRDAEYQNCIYLLFKPDDMDKFRNFLDSELERTNDIVEDYDYDGGYVVVVYKLNPKFEKDFVIVKEGKYSKTEILLKMRNDQCSRQQILLQMLRSSGCQDCL